MIEFDDYLNALQETFYMTILSTIFVFILGLVLGIFLYMTSKNGLTPNQPINMFLSMITSIGRSIPFLILIVLLIPVTRTLVGTILGPNAAIPALVVGASPFYARLVELSLHEKGKDLKETGASFGATNATIITKIIIPEAKAGLIRGITVTAITIAGYTSIAGAIGAGGLGNLAYLYGYARNQHLVTIIATLLMVLLILFIQFIGDITVKKLTHK